MKKRKYELILPTSDLRKTEFALKYGADACYGGLAKYSLRKNELDFNFKTLKKAIDLAHSLGKKFYVTFNIFARNENLKTLKEDIKKISSFKPDAFVISDTGIIQFVKKHSKVPIHLSTQANTTNWQAVKFWKEQGIKRIILARELSLNEIKEIKKKVPGIELEIFVHGAMCIAYAGRCLLSSVMTGREANQGDCTQPCRWKYKTYIEEELRPGEFFPVKSDKEGTYIFNSRDLRLIKHLPEIIDAGITGLKIEGRSKSEYYLSTIAFAYKKSLEAIEDKNFKKALPKLLAETEKIAHRDYTTGFLFDKAKKGETYNKRGPIENYKFLGIIEDSKENYSKIVIRNQLKKGSSVEILTPEKVFKDKVLEIIIDRGKVKVANPLPGNKKILIKLSKDYPISSLLRRVEK